LARISAIDNIIRFWATCKPRIDGLPLRESVDPFALRPWLGHCAIYEAIDDGADFRVRLEGSFISDLGGENWTGRRASEIDTRYGSHLLIDLCRIATVRACEVATIVIVQADFIEIERAFLPFTLGTGKVDQIIGCMYRVTDRH
jgi:hypothetical protein